MTTIPYIDERVASTIRRTINRIESEHDLLLSVLLSAISGVVTGMFVSELVQAIMLGNITLLAGLIARMLSYIFAASFISFLIVATIYMLIRGKYCATFTLVFDPSNFQGDWREVFKAVLTAVKSYHICEGSCEEVSEIRNKSTEKHLTCSHIYKNFISLEIKSYSFRTLSIIPLTITLLANPFKVLILELRYSPLILAIERLKYRRSGVTAVEIDSWYEVFEDLVFFFDNVKRSLENLGIKLKDVIA